MQRFETIPGLTHNDSEPPERHPRQATPTSSLRSVLRVDDFPGQGKTRPPRKIHALDDAELEASMDRLRLEGIKPDAVPIPRFSSAK